MFSSSGVAASNTSPSARVSPVRKKRRNCLSIRASRNMEHGCLHARSLMQHEIRVLAQLDRRFPVLATTGLDE
ncbi:MAG: hypothetical protein AAF196_04475 [Planctomycetota bacterium]